jgi:hypothetical protein
VWEIRVLLLWIVWVVGFGASSCEEKNRIVEGGERERERERERRWYTKKGINKMKCGRKLYSKIAFVPHEF